MLVQRGAGSLVTGSNEAGTKTASAPKFRQMELSLKKLIGLCYATDELLQDAGTLESVLKQGFAEEFCGGHRSGSIIRGTGVGQPLGILTSPCLVTVTRSAATTVASADVINMWSEDRIHQALARRSG